MSPREEAANWVYEWLVAHKEYNAPWGVLSSKSPCNRYRSVTFGRARCLDAEVRIYNPNFVMIRWMRGRHMDSAIMKGDNAVSAAIRFIEYEL